MRMRLLRTDQRQRHHRGIATAEPHAAAQPLEFGRPSIERRLDIESVPPHAYYIVQHEQAPMKPEAQQFVDWLLGLDW